MKKKVWNDGPPISQYQKRQKIKIQLEYPPTMFLYRYNEGVE